MICGDVEQKCRRAEVFPLCNFCTSALTTSALICFKLSLNYLIKGYAKVYVYFAVIGISIGQVFFINRVQVGGDAYA